MTLIASRTATWFPIRVTVIASALSSPVTFTGRARAGRQICEILVRDLVNGSVLSDENELGAAAYARPGAVAIGHLFLALGRRLMFRAAGAVADPADPSSRRRRGRNGGKSQREYRWTRKEQLHGEIIRLWAAVMLRARPPPTRSSRECRTSSVMTVLSAERARSAMRTAAEVTAATFCS